MDKFLILTEIDLIQGDQQPLVNKTKKATWRKEKKKKSMRSQETMELNIEILGGAFGSAATND